MFKDERRSNVWDDIRQRGIRAFADKVTPALLAETANCSGVRLVKCPLGLMNLTWLGIAAAIHTSCDFASVLIGTLKVLQDHQTFGSSTIGKAKKNGARRKPKQGSKHHPHRNDPTEVTEEAFVQARRRMPLSSWVNLIILLGEAFQEKHADQLKFREFRLLAIDGTRINLPNWKKLRDHFGTAKNARGKQAAQARMVTLQFPLARLPYRYELCPLDDGEVTIARRLSDVKDAERGGGDAPDPVLLAVVFDACFVAAKLFLLWNRCGEFVVGIAQRSGDRTRAQFRQVATGHGDLQHIFHPGFQRRVAQVAHRLQPAYRGQQSRPEDGPLQLRRIGRVEVAGGISVDGQLIIGNVNRRFGQFDPLNDVKVAGRCEPQSLDILVIDFPRDGFVHTLRRQRLAELPLMSALPSLAPLPLPWQFLWFRLNDITRWRLGRCG